MKKYSNFHLTGARGTSIIDLTHYATVTEETTTGMWFWKDTVKCTVKIYANYPTGWAFMESGDWCPRDVDNLSRAFEAQHRKPLKSITEKDF